MLQAHSTGCKSGACQNRASGKGACGVESGSDTRNKTTLSLLPVPESLRTTQGHMANQWPISPFTSVAVEPNQPKILNFQGILPFTVRCVYVFVCVLCTLLSIKHLDHFGRMSSSIHATVS